MKSLMTLLFVLGVFAYAQGQEASAGKQSASKGATAVEQSAAGEKEGEAKAESSAKDLGIGPIKEVKLGTIDPKVADEGRKTFNDKCVVCHDLDAKRIGPPLRDVTKRATPEFIMNMLLNTTEMVQKNETVKKLVAEYHVPMTDQGLSEKQARAVLEYLRQAGEKSKAK